MIIMCKEDKTREHNPLILGALQVKKNPKHPDITDLVPNKKLENRPKNSHFNFAKPLGEGPERIMSTRSSHVDGDETLRLK